MHNKWMELYGNLAEKIRLTPLMNAEIGGETTVTDCQLATKSVPAIAPVVTTYN